MSGSVDESLPPHETSLNLITKTKLNLQRSLIHFFTSSKCVKTARLAMQQNPIKVIKESKRKSVFILNSFSDDQINVFSGLC